MQKVLKLGRRELNKEDKLRRIKAAARKLFVSNGYDDASTREIAVKAGIALGTLFLYAADKRDLLFLVVNDELDDVATKAAQAVNPNAGLMSNLLAAFRPLYEFFGEEPRLSRLMLREMIFYETGAQAKRFMKTRDRMISLCVGIAEIAKRRREIRSSVDEQAAGEVLFAIFQIEVRRWLASRQLSLEKGLTRLEAAFSIAVTGLSRR